MVMTMHSLINISILCFIEEGFLLLRIIGLEKYLISSGVYYIDGAYEKYVVIRFDSLGYITSALIFI